MRAARFTFLHGVVTAVHTSTVFFHPMVQEEQIGCVNA
jgi:hypothetical protein